MLTQNNFENNNIQIDVFNAIVGYDDNQTNSKKDKKSKRMFAARRAIEQHQETKQLSLYINEVWFSEGR
ncbi:MAG: hypothetical protein V7784_22060 [Oceanospirillaceae bacterium]